MSSDRDPTKVADRVIAQGCALVRVIEGMDVIVPIGWFERMLVRILQAAYKHRLWEIVKVLPAWMVAKVERILSASETPRGPDPRSRTARERFPLMWLSSSV